LPPCPECGKPLRAIRGPRGIFYGCSNYPTCKFAVNDKPTFETCPTCGHMLLEKKHRDGVYLSCSNRTCDFSVKK
ncbi:MAG: topoisomerase DNA-binding C4 zinc finger domain-containing protein, partial [Clostridia bacterium]|nr:topoisomerase DNA-binding C4 zinc finger domain-containing protein [Clostridia bacterium]